MRINKKRLSVLLSTIAACAALFFFVSAVMKDMRSSRYEFGSFMNEQARSREIRESGLTRKEWADQRQARCTAEAKTAVEGYIAGGRRGQFWFHRDSDAVVYSKHLDACIGSVMGYEEFIATDERLLAYVLRKNAGEYIALLGGGGLAIILVVWLLVFLIPAALQSTWRWLTTGVER